MKPPYLLIFLLPISIFSEESATFQNDQLIRTTTFKALDTEANTASCSLGDTLLGFLNKGSDQGPSQSLENEFDKVRASIPNTDFLDLFRLGRTLAWQYMGFRVLYYFGIVLIFYIFFVVLAFFAWRFGEGRLNVPPSSLEETTVRLRINLATLILLTTLSFFGITLALASILESNAALTKDGFTYTPFFEKLRTFDEAWYATSAKFLFPAEPGKNDTIEMIKKSIDEGDALFEKVFSQLPQEDACRKSISNFAIKMTDLWTKYGSLETTFEPAIRQIGELPSDQSLQFEIINLFKNPTAESADIYKWNVQKAYNQEMAQTVDFSNFMKLIDSSRESLNRIGIQSMNDQSIKAIIVSNTSTDGKGLLALLHFPTSVKDTMRLARRLFDKFNATYAIEERATSWIGPGIPFILVPTMIALLTVAAVFLAVSDNANRKLGVVSRKSDLPLMLLVLLIFINVPILVLPNLYIFFTSGVLEASLCQPLNRFSGGSTRMLDDLFMRILRDNFKGHESQWPLLNQMEFFHAIWFGCKDKPFVEAFNVTVKENDTDISPVLSKMAEDFAHKEFKVFTRQFNEMKRQVSGLKLDALYKKLSIFDRQSTNGLISRLQDDTNIDETKFDEFIKKFNFNQAKMMHGELQDFEILLKNEDNNFFANEKECQKDLRNHLKSLIENRLSPNKLKILDLIKSSLNKTLSIGCKDIHSAAHQMSDHFCQTFVQSFNGFLYGLGLCVVLYYPILLCILGLLKKNCAPLGSDDSGIQKNEQQRKNKKKRKG